MTQNSIPGPWKTFSLSDNLDTFSSHAFEGEWPRLFIAHAAVAGVPA